MNVTEAPRPRAHRLSTAYIVFLVVAAAAPLASMIGNLPIAIARGTGLYVPIAFLIAGAILIAFTKGYAFIGRRVVSTGAFYTYVAEGLGKPLGVGSAYCAILAYGTFTLGLAAACGYFDGQVFDAIGSHVDWTVCAAVSVLLAGFLNHRSMDVSSKLLAVIIVVETAVLVVFDASVVAQRGWAAFPLSSFAPAGWIAPGIGVSLMTAFTCFVGFESGALYSKEAADPVRSIPLASYVSVVLIGSFYLVTAWITVGAIGTVDTQAKALAGGGTLFLDLIMRYDGQTASGVAGLLLCTSMLATYIAIHAAASRYVFALAREGLLPRSLSRFDERSNVPVAATLAMSAVTVVCIGALALAVRDPYVAAIPVLIGTGTLGIIALQAMAAIAIVAYAFARRRDAGAGVLFAAVVAAIGLAIALATVCVNFTLLSAVSAPAVAWLPLLYPATLVAGLCFSLWLRRARPAHYHGLALVEHHESASPAERGAITIHPVLDKADRQAFVDLPFRLYRNDPAWVPPLKSEAYGLITPGKNPFFEHARTQLFLAERDGEVVGRISASIDELWTTMAADKGGGPDTGNWGYLDAEDKPVADLLIAAAEDWLRGQGVRRALGPVSMSIWEEPGLLIRGHDHPPTVMMGHDDPRYEAWVESWGYRKAMDLHTWDLDITREFPPIVQRIVASGERNPRIRVRNVDKRKFDQEAAIILGILNDAWSDNWGFVPFTPSEIAFAGKKMKPIIFNDLVQVAEYDGEPVAFMLTLPNLNEMQMDLDGELFPFGFAKLLWRLNGGLSGRPTVDTIRVPLMGVVKRLQASRLASQLAFMMIERVRRASVEHYGATRGEIGWILENNQGMNSIAETIVSRINKTYRIYEKAV